MIRYYDLGGDKQINEVVFAGSHDAAITFGSSNVQTQSLDILEQARAGVRVFDLRITATTLGSVGGQKTAELVAFHADDKVKKDETKLRYVHGFDRYENITRSKLSGGGFGMALDRILAGAKAFVESGEGATEFLILKFDKCNNWPLIAEACVYGLRGALYRGTGNINKKTLKELRGHVIVTFTPGGLQAARGTFPLGSGILGIKNLAGGGDGYLEGYDGIQYYGKGGTSPFKAFKKLSQNEKKQAKLMAAGGHGNPDVMGMMYWTTTGLKESIYKRDKTMWTAPNKAKLQSLWNNGLQEAVGSAIPKNVDLTAFSSGPAIKVFMPNIVMIDFADETKCQTIYDLNAVASNVLVQLARDTEMVELDEI